MTNFSKRALLLCGSLLAFAASAQAAEIAMAANSTGKNLNFIRERLAEFEQQSAHKVKLVTMPPSSSEQFSQYRLWLAAGNTDVDVYQTDIVWAPQLADQFVDFGHAPLEFRERQPLESEIAINGVAQKFRDHRVEDLRRRTDLQNASVIEADHPGDAAVGGGGDRYDAALRILTKRPVVAGPDEIASNPRARSAKTFAGWRLIRGRSHHDRRSSERITRRSVTCASA